MPANTDQFVSVGVDYLTCTFQGKKEAKYGATKAFDLLETEMGRGNFRKPWAMSGFNGFAAGSVQVGEREGDVLVRISSHVAADHWRDIAERATNCSRIDYQVTTRNGRDPARRIKSHWKEARKFKQAGKSKAAVAAFFGDGICPTLYLGRRVSNRFGRIYDKEKESGDDRWNGCVRYEVEFKNEAAHSMMCTLLAQPDPALSVAANCLQMFQDRGIHLTWFLQGVGNYSCIAPPNDVMRRLQWLQTQVKPSVALLFSLGLGPEVEKVLGLAVDTQGRITLSGPTWANEQERMAS